MTVYHVETQQAYDELMIELEEKGCKWRGGERLTNFDEFKTHGKDTYVYDECGVISASSENYFKEHYSNETAVEYKTKGENMTQEEMKRNLQKNAFDVYVAVETFAVRRGITEVETDLKEAKSSAKKLIEKIDEYLESQHPKFKVGDYFTLDIPNNKKIAKIDRLNGDALHGLWYDIKSKIIEQDFYFGSGIAVRHATQEEIAEYKAALQFHKHGRKPFEVKKGDLVRTPREKFTFIWNAEYYTKEDFLDSKWGFLKTVEEVNEWLNK